ncbi:putative glycosyl transferase 2 [Candidatus Gastranaerophilus sp. (ex Termes propinquus)]|nr:putative glycosyl transferase 2 [Candidatus Gastranaerophilus sp. (ex Termes propinquus)]
MQSKPLVSVYIPYYGDEDVLRDAIDSVLSQTYENFELILLNHATEDSCRDIAHTYDDKRIIHIDMEKNAGAGGGFIVAEVLKKASGKYLKPFCADDIMTPNCLETLVNCLEQNPSVDFVFGDMEYVDMCKKPLGRKWSTERACFDFDNNEKDLLKLYFRGVSTLSIVAALVKTEDMRNIPLNESYIMLPDMTFWIRLLLKGKKIRQLKDIVAKYRIHEGQMAYHGARARIVRQCYFETVKYCNCFYEIDNLDILKTLCEGSVLLDKLSAEDTKYFPFVIAHYYLTSQLNNAYKMSAYVLIFDMLKDEMTKKELEEKFDFGLREFRALYSEIPAASGSLHNLLHRKPYLRYSPAVIKRKMLKALTKKIAL